MTDGRGDSEDILRFLASNVESICDKVGGVENRLSGIETRIGRVEDHMATKEDVTAIRGDIERVDLRIGNIDRTLSTRMDQVDGAVSRLRSAVYLLAKDRPEILRVLGEE